VIRAGEMKRDLAQAGEITRRMPIADTAAVFGKDDIQDPVQSVLDRPMPTHSLAEPHGIELGAGEEAADLGRGLDAPLTACEKCHCQVLNEYDIKARQYQSTHSDPARRSSVRAKPI
jgi:hypothetical protein